MQPLHAQSYELELDLDYSPPLVIPQPEQQIYNAPANDYMLEPVKVRLLLNNLLVLTPITVTATTILASNVNVSGNPGDTYNGTLCVHSNWLHINRACRYEDCVRFKCNSTDPQFPLGKVEAVTESGVASFHRLLHTHPSTNGQRRLRFFAEISSTVVNVSSHAFNVDCKFL